MARKTNKTDHVLNLLSSGGKKASPKKDDSDTPPVDLNPKKTTPQEEAPNEEQQAEASSSETDFGINAAEEEIASGTEADSLQETVGIQQQSETVQPDQIKPETKTISVPATETPTISVVHTSGEENPIADAVKDSLEAELDAYMEQKNQNQQKEPAQESVKPEQSVNAPELLGTADEEVDEAMTEATPESSAAVSTEIPVSGMPDTVETQSVSDAGEAPAAEAQAAGSKPEADFATESEPAAMDEPEAGAVTAKPEPAAIEPDIDRKQENGVTPATEVKADPGAGLASAPGPKPQAAQAEPAAEEKDYTIVNVMEALVRDQVPKYVRQFGHCDCERCIEDTIALALTHLPAKYVVIDKNAVSPMLNFYEKRYAGQLIVEITKATMIVNESPKH